MNKNHWPSGTPVGGQFMPKNAVGIIRNEKMQNDIDSYIDSEYFESNNPADAKKRIENINNALYDGGYILEKGDDLCGFSSPREAENFIYDISTIHNEKNAWVKHKNLVENYVEVAKGYINRGKFDLVIDGHKSADGSKRVATELITELNWDKEDVQKTLVASLSADAFVNSGKNNSNYEPNKGTVIMVFSPRVETRRIITNDEGKKIEQRKCIDLYVKMVLNPHPDRKRHQTEMQILSFREAGIIDKNDSRLGKENPKVCLYTGEEHRSRWEWQMDKFKNHRNKPKTIAELRAEEKNRK